MSIAHITDPQVHRNRPSGSRPIAHISAIRTLPEIRPRRKGNAKARTKAVKPHDPHTPRDPDMIIRGGKRGGSLDALMVAFVGIVVTGLAFGFFPQLGIWWDQFNQAIQSHNDDVVNGIMTAAPFLGGALALYILYRIACWISTPGKTA